MTLETTVRDTGTPEGFYAYVRDLEQCLDRALAEIETSRANQAALARRGAELVHENMRLRLQLADRHAPTPTPSLAAIEAMQRSGIR